MTLNRQQLRSLARLERDLDRMARKLTPAGYSNRHSARWALKLADLRDRLAALAAVDADVIELVDRAQLLQAHLVTMTIDQGSLGARSGLGGGHVARIDDAHTRLNALEEELSAAKKVAMNDWMCRLAEIERSLMVLPLSNTIVVGLQQRCQSFADRIEALTIPTVIEATITFFDGEIQLCA